MSIHVPPSQLAVRLVDTLAGYGSTLVAFSGGVDSGLVLAAAARALGPDRAVAVTAISPSLPAAELDAAREFVAALGLRHLTPETDEWRRPEYQANDGRRCYFCKSALMEAASPLRATLGLATICTGTNASDAVAGFRPGIAAAAERGARTPLRDLGMTKDAVRSLARLWGLTLADKPAMACLASRIAYGVRVQPWRLARVERAEVALRALLTAQLSAQPREGAVLRDLRVRDLGDSVRVEVDAELVEFAAAHAGVHEAVTAAGFGGPVRVEAFRSGSLNDALRGAPNDTLR